MSEEKTMSETVAEQLDKIAENVPHVYQSGHDSWLENYVKGIEENQKGLYHYAFAFYGWNDSNFRGNNLKITPKNQQKMFANTQITDLRKETTGIELDFSQCGDMTYVVCDKAKVKYIGVLDCSLHDANSRLRYFLYNLPDLISVEKVILPPSNSFQTYGFVSNNNLTEIRFEGYFTESVSFQWCPLSLASMKSIISCLKNYHGTDYDMTYYLKFKDDCWARLEADSTSPNGNTWKEYVQELGWTI